jgi:hypothetical protein
MTEAISSILSMAPKLQRRGGVVINKAGPARLLGRRRVFVG